VGTLYDELGVSADATAADLRRAYRRQARLRHPDLRHPDLGHPDLGHPDLGHPDLGHPDLGLGREHDSEAAMRRLNAAWAVLGEPASRRRYDESLRVAAGAAGRTPPTAATAARTAPGPAPGGGDVRTLDRGPRHILWFVALAVMAAIFVFTAYAGGHDEGRPRPPAGRCLTAVPGLEHYVPCDQPNVGRLVTEVGPGGPCPQGSFRHVLVSRNQVACLTR
jgi:hypothetical protein